MTPSWSLQVAVSATTRDPASSMSISGGYGIGRC
jgi:hypothetical protein